ncbi:MAG: hypothetical protein Hyperionvirus17_32 [Hyperionvirus sp.]|uniref:RING-type domain-containing protein n=1 Tax=Hyperionvirus sp. TaxID=2487770 RepID=A0A3G5AAJ2_9VIRU|nr:MAG: hypothetical protein Hyperionvirus17_32 [Hyperionvirus sp.]
MDNKKLYDKEEINALLKRVNIHIYSDDYFIREINKVVEGSSQRASSPYYYCEKQVMKKIENLQQAYVKLYGDGSLEEECCICLEKTKFEGRVYFSCKHFVCNMCYIELKILDSKCPICRAVICVSHFSEKYALMCTGVSTRLYTFENGGYNSIVMAYFPEYNNESHSIFSNITYHEENYNRTQFIIRIYKLLEDGYIILLQQPKELKKWMNEVMLKDLAADPRIV